MYETMLDRFIDFKFDSGNGSVLVPKKGCTILQFIGRHDSRDTPVYEGDIVELDGARAVVRWDDGCCSFYLDTLDEDKWCEDWDMGDLYRFTVVGNINNVQRVILK